MRDGGSFEKAEPPGTTLPRSDEPTTTPGNLLPARRMTPSKEPAGCIACGFFGDMPYLMTVTFFAMSYSWGCLVTALWPTAMATSNL